MHAHIHTHTHTYANTQFISFLAHFTRQLQLAIIYMNDNLCDKSKQSRYLFMSTKYLHCNAPKNLEEWKMQRIKSEKKTIRSRCTYTHAHIHSHTQRKKMIHLNNFDAITIVCSISCISIVRNLKICNLKKYSHFHAITTTIMVIDLFFHLFQYNDFTD